MFYKYFPYKNMNHHQILLYGFHFSFLFIFFLSVARDLYFEKLFNASINFSGFLFTFLSYILLHFRQRERLSSYFIIIIAIVPLYILIYFNHFGNLVIIYVILIPLAVFFLLPFRQAFILNLFIFLLLACMLYYISTIQPDSPILNNPKALINLTFVSMLTMLFGIFYHMAIESNIQKLTRSNNEKDILLKEVHHRVKNNLNLTAAMLGLQAIDMSEEIRIHILKSKTRIESIAAVHEMLYKQESFDQIHFYDYTIRLEELLRDAYSGNDEYQLHIDIDPSLAFPLNTMVQFGLMMNEMLANSLKYAKSQDGLVISISLHKEEDMYIFEYADNGINSNCLQDLETHAGLGSRLIQLSVQQINAEMTCIYEEGLKYQLRIKNG